MITSIKIKSIPGFSEREQEFDDLSKINLIYGANGSGKTTISRVLEKPVNYPQCTVSWNHGQQLEVLVYNRDFVEKNFHQDVALKGIFTLGETNTTTLKEIEQTKINIDEMQKVILQRRNTLTSENGKNHQIETLEDKFKEQCWKFKTIYDDDFKEIFRGRRNDKQNFKDELIKWAEQFKSMKLDTMSLQTLDQLRTTYATLFISNREKLSLLATIPCDYLIEIEKTPILAKKVIGKGSRINNSYTI